MRTGPMLVGVAAGVVIAAGAIAGADLATESADAQGGDAITKGDLVAANQRASAAINGYKNLNNILGKYVAEPNELIGAKSGPIEQNRGLGGGLPTEVIANDAVTETKLSAGVRAKLDAGGPAGPAGPAGPQGPRGQSFGDGRQVPNQNDIPCSAATVVGTLPVQLNETSRIWTHGHGSVQQDGALADEYALYLQLRNEATQVVAVSTAAWDEATAVGDTDQVHQLTTGGVMLAGTNPNAPSAPFDAPAGTYQLELVVEPVGACPGPLPNFGYNQGANMSYMPIGTG